jgi:hypothetical protein
MPWKPEYAERRREKYKANPDERERRKAQGRSPEENSAYMRLYYVENREKFSLSDEDKQRRNEARRQRYASDPEFRERAKAASRNRCPSRKRELRIIAQFGIDNARYDAMLAEQNGGCAICGSEKSSARGERLAVDHCHKTGAVRGLLCSNCNQGLGKFKDNAAQLRKAVAYLERFVCD